MPGHRLSSGQLWPTPRLIPPLLNSHPTLCYRAVPVEHLDLPAMADVVDPRMTSIKPRIRYNTIGGINGPLVVLDNVRSSGQLGT